ncbi:MAG: TIGR02281 family clan AA aspartic protease [Rhodobacteraceae bacterium]|nr:MAG: TIGR02281 family clan AA aspartic protease [Paracoccaceae bacterium]
MEFDGDQIARLVYLGIWGTVLISYMLISRAQRLGESLRHLVLWALIFVGVAAGYGLWQDVSAPARIAVSGDGALVLRADRSGHFNLTMAVNGTPTDFMLDTGATEIVLTQADAARAGFDPQALSYLGEARTANGIVRTARVTLDEVVLGADDLEFRDRDVIAYVNEGALDVSLLGMAYLRRFARITIEGDTLVLER